MIGLPAGLIPKNKMAMEKISNSQNAEVRYMQDLEWCGVVNVRS
jgi:hypothetical protein